MKTMCLNRGLFSSYSSTFGEHQKHQTFPDFSRLCRNPGDASIDFSSLAGAVSWRSVAKVLY